MTSATKSPALFPHANTVTPNTAGRSPSPAQRGDARQKFRRRRADPRHRRREPGRERVSPPRRRRVVRGGRERRRRGRRENERPRRPRRRVRRAGERRRLGRRETNQDRSVNAGAAPPRGIDSTDAGPRPEWWRGDTPSRGARRSVDASASRRRWREACLDAAARRSATPPRAKSTAKRVPRARRTTSPRTTSPPTRPRRSCRRPRRSSPSLTTIRADRSRAFVHLGLARRSMGSRATAGRRVDVGLPSAFLPSALRVRDEHRRGDERDVIGEGKGGRRPPDDSTVSDDGEERDEAHEVRGGVEEERRGLDSERTRRRRGDDADDDGRWTKSPAETTATMTPVPSSPTPRISRGWSSAASEKAASEAKTYDRRCRGRGG